MKLLAVIVLSILFVGSTYAGYHYGENKGHAEGYSVGYNAAPKPDTGIQVAYD